ncbi:DUF4919 domain-containing protein [Sphingomonas sp. AP4-R1]|uniref:DUF4919 domain-containing protein n=1 Tax=Sphingomonas sp. AP4-R1 TaxID=2735134 RepID=UPI0014939CA6|nr:DUF4919 domain-containing protein [Sphingomonas sp. AP4-R1]QJU59387.1 DUF4919 domain-containing protein [Sphingomonas sp. AP4-R1]
MHKAVVVALLISTASGAQPVPTSKHIQKIMAKGDGLTPATAFKVSSVKEEYQIAAALGLKVQSQSLVVQKKPFDMLQATNEAGDAREVWFDISSFYPEF